MKATSFDSNILIDALLGDARAQRELAESRNNWISRVTWIEVLSKVDAETLPRTSALLATFKIDELTLPIAQRAAELRNERRALKLADAVILASAQVNGRTLVTRNIRDFRPDMPGIRMPYLMPD